MLSIAELLKALPGEVEGVRESGRLDPEHASMRPIPVGRLRRLGLLGTLQAKIAAAYLFHWLRGWFVDAGANERELAETHWKTALRMMDAMGYMRGATMKIGQTLANFPDIAPHAFVETLDQFHFEAPPMHWSLLKEMVRNELGDAPEELFDQFDQRAFAAASLGQVHRGRLRTGEDVAVKVQYPGVARAIGEDLRNLLLVLLPSRMTSDWHSVKGQFDELRRRLEMECNYALEAAYQEKCRQLFHTSDRIVVPRVFPQYSTERVLTMEYIEGDHLEAYLARNPSQQERNSVAESIMRALCRMMYAGRMVYVDFHPGNILFLSDGRIALLDFGMMLPLDDELWRGMALVDRAMSSGRREDRDRANKYWCELTDEECSGERMELIDEYADWCWRSRYCGGTFDFGNEADFRRGVDLFLTMVKRRYSRAKSCTPLMARSQFGWRSILYRLKAQIDVRPIAEEEVQAAGWGRIAYE